MKGPRELWLGFFGLFLLGVATTHVAPAQKTATIQSAEASVSAQRIREQDKFLSDDLLEGRGPGMRGGEIAAQYIATQFALYGLKPAGDNGTFLQQVNFVGTQDQRRQDALLVRAGQAEGRRSVDYATT